MATSQSESDATIDDFYMSTGSVGEDDEILNPHEQELFARMNDFLVASCPRGVEFSALLETIMQRFLYERQQRYALESILRDQVIDSFETQLTNLKVSLIDQKLRARELAKAAAKFFPARGPSSVGSSAPLSGSQESESESEKGEGFAPQQQDDEQGGEKAPGDAAAETAEQLNILIAEVESSSGMGSAAAPLLAPRLSSGTYKKPVPPGASPMAPVEASGPSATPVRVSIPKRGMYKTISVTPVTTAAALTQLLLSRAFPDATTRSEFDGWVLRCVMGDGSTQTLLPDVEVLGVPNATDQFLFTPSDVDLIRHGTLGVGSRKGTSIPKTSSSPSSAGSPAVPSRIKSATTSNSSLLPSFPPPAAPLPKGKPPGSVLQGSSSAPAEPLSALAQNIMDEILNSERDYLRDVTLFQTQFCAPIKGNLTVVSDSEYSKLVSSWATIFDLHTELGKSLEAGPMALGTVFCAHASTLLKAYTRYAAENVQALEVLASLKAGNPHFANHVAKFEKLKEANHNNVDSFLVKPVQRICKYPLLLSELVSNVPASFPDLENLRKALQKMKDITNDINEMKRFSENLHALQSIQEQIQGMPASFKLIISTRYFVLEDTMVKISKGKAQTRHLWLFNDVLIYAKIQQGVHRFAGRVFLAECLVRDLPDTATRQFAFEIDRRDKKKKVYIIIAGDQRMKHRWFTTLVDLISQQNNIQANSRLSVRLKLRDTNDFSAMAARSGLG